MLPFVFYGIKFHIIFQIISIDKGEIILMKRVSILGSTGSIGTQSIEVCEKHGLEIIAIAAHSSIDMLEEQA